jgi:uncharacterized membrane protein YvbJ
LASASAPLISREEIEQAVTEQMATDPREISRKNEVVFITVAAVVCIMIFVRQPVRQGLSAATVILLQPI